MCVSPTASPRQRRAVVAAQASGLHGHAHGLREAGGFTVTERVYAPGMRIARHDHARASVCIVLDGAYDEDYGRRSRRAEPGTVIVHPEGEHHGERHDPVPTTLLSIELDPARLQSTRPTLRTFDDAWHRRDPAIVALAWRLRHELDRADANALALESAVTELIGALDGRALPATRRAAWLRDVRERLDAAYHDAPTLQALAEGAGVHPVHLARAFRREFGCSIGSYVRRLQVGHAALLLQSGSALADAAGEAGFADQAHMTRLFRAQTGLTPGAWRRRAAVKVG